MTLMMKLVCMEELGRFGKEVTVVSFGAYASSMRSRSGVRWSGSMVDWTGVFLVSARIMAE